MLKLTTCGVFRPKSTWLTASRSAMCGCVALVFAGLLGCSATSGTSGGKPFPWSKSAPKPTTYEQLVAEQQQRKIGAPALGLNKNTNPSPAAKAAAAMSPAALAKSLGDGVKRGSDKLASASRPEPQSKTPFSFSKKKQASPEVFVSLGQMQEQAGDFASAAAQYETALKADPENAAALMSYARLLDRQGQLPKAVEYYQRAIKAQPDSAAPLNDLGLCYARNDHFDEAIDCLTAAIELEPKRELYRNNMATMLVSVGRVDEAVQQVAVVYGRGVAHYNVGLLLTKQGNRDAAYEQFTLALAAKPDLAEAQQWLAQLSAPAEEQLAADDIEQGTQQAANASGVAPIPQVAALPAEVHMTSGYSPLPRAAELPEVQTPRKLPVVAVPIRRMSHEEAIDPDAPAEIETAEDPDSEESTDDESADDELLDEQGLTAELSGEETTDEEPTADESDEEPADTEPLATEDDAFLLPDDSQEHVFPGEQRPPVAAASRTTSQQHASRPSVAENAPSAVSAQAAPVGRRPILTSGFNPPNRY